MSFLKKHSIQFFLIAIICIAGVLRLFLLGGVPISPDWDEVSLGYNAYSILVTGKDEYGAMFPIVLRSFDDYKPAFYAYLVIPFIELFGLSVVAVRLPSALIGIATVGATYFLVKELFVHGLKQKHEITFSTAVALLASFLLAISPWHIQFSRVAFEANVAMGLNVFGILFFFKGLRKGVFLPLSSSCFALGLYTYQSEKVFVPLILFCLLVFFRRQVFALSQRMVVLSTLVLVVVSLPLVVVTLTNHASLLRAQGVSVLSPKAPQYDDILKRYALAKENGDIIGMVLNNKWSVYAKGVIGNYIAHFDVNWLFLKGDFDVQRHHAPGMGLLYLWELPFFLIGLFTVFVGKKEFLLPTKVRLFLLGWLFIAPIPAAFTTGVPHAVRTINSLPTFQIFTAVGLISSYLFFFKRNAAISKYALVRSVLIFLFAIFVGCNVMYYLNQYFVQQNFFYAKDWQYGYKQLIDFLRPIDQRYSKIIVSNQDHMQQSYMFFLFYLQYDPKQYLAQGGTESGRIEEHNSFGKFVFRPLDYYTQKESRLLLIGMPRDFPEVFSPIHYIVYPDQTRAMQMVEKNM